MDYVHITNLLDRFKKILSSKEESHSVVSEIIHKYTKINIKNNGIRIKNAVIYIEDSPLVRNEVLIHKDKILTDLKTLLPESRFLDIK